MANRDLPQHIISQMISQHRDGTNNDIWVPNTTSQQQQSSQMKGATNYSPQMPVPPRSSRVFINPSLAYLAGQKKTPPNQSNAVGLPTVSKPQKILINPKFMTTNERKLIQLNIEKNFHSKVAKEEQTSAVTQDNNRKILEEPPVRPKTILVNPNFKGSKSLPSIHINSKVFATALSTQQSQPPVASKLPAIPVSATSTKPLNKFAVNTTKKLVRQLGKEVQPQPIVAKPQMSNPLVSINKRKLVRLSSRVSKVTPIQKTATENRITTQFKPKVTSKEFAVTKKYSLKRVKSKPNSDALPQSSKYKFVKNAKPVSNNFSKSRYKLNKKVAHTQSSMKIHRKNLLKSHIQSKYNWQRSSTSRPQVYHANKRYQYRRTMGSQDKRYYKFNINGRRFIMDPQGKTLRYMPVTKPQEHSSAIKPISLNRIYVAGATYKAKAPNVYVRTNDHAVRNLVSQAKYKSISLLVNKLRKNNKPCVFYRRFGKCIRKEKGTCPCVHDPKQIAICKRFLWGKCEDKDCLLSHDVRPEKMPTCQYFLDGCCTRKPCPYLHVKVNANANVCQDFVAGYCASGSLCKKRHVNICPGTPHSGTCNKGKECQFLHKNPKKKQRAKIANRSISPHAELVAKPVENCDQDVAENARYYQNEGTVGPPLPLSSIQVETQSQNSNPLVCVSNKKRQKIGTLPSFIPL